MKFVSLEELCLILTCVTIYADFVACFILYHSIIFLEIILHICSITFFFVLHVFVLSVHVLLSQSVQLLEYIFQA